MRGARRSYLVPLLAILPVLAGCPPPPTKSTGSSNEASALAYLRAIYAAQVLFRTGDKEGDGQFDYGELAELVEGHLVSGSLASGTADGYVFTVVVNREVPEFAWYAVAVPRAPSGEKQFLITQEGTLFEFTGAVAPITSLGKVTTSVPGVRAIR